MSETSRRKFLITAGAGAAVAATAATVGVRAADATGGEGGGRAELPKDAQGPLVAYVSDVQAGEVAVMVGESQVVVKDPALVARLMAVRTGRS